MENLKTCKNGADCHHKDGPLQLATSLHFHRNAKSKDGFKSECKACVRHNYRNRPRPQWWIDCLEYWGNCCAACGLPGDKGILSVDHWIPRSKGGQDSLDNIIPLCCHIFPFGPHHHPCNPNKGTLPGDEWLIKRFGEQTGRAKLSEIEAYFDWVRQHRK